MEFIYSISSIIYHIHIYSMDINIHVHVHILEFYFNISTFYFEHDAYVNFDTF